MFDCFPDVRLSNVEESSNTTFQYSNEALEAWKRNCSRVELAKDMQKEQNYGDEGEKKRRKKIEESR